MKNIEIEVQDASWDFDCDGRQTVFHLQSEWGSLLIAPLQPLRSAIQHAKLTDALDVLHDRERPWIVTFPCGAISTWTLLTPGVNKKTSAPENIFAESRLLIFPQTLIIRALGINLRAGRVPEVALFQWIFYGRNPI